MIRRLPARDVELAQMNLPLLEPKPLQAAERATKQKQMRMQALSLGLEQARYQARLAEHRYESADPENRLVTGELEARWNAALHHVADLEKLSAPWKER